MTPGEIQHANNIGVLPLEDINPGTVTLNLNAVVRNPETLQNNKNTKALINNFNNEKSKKQELNFEFKKKEDFFRVQSMEMDNSKKNILNLDLNKELNKKSEKWAKKNTLFSKEKNKILDNSSKMFYLKKKINTNDIQTSDNQEGNKSNFILKKINTKNLVLKPIYTFNYISNNNMMINNYNSKRKKKSFKFKRQNSFSRKRHRRDIDNKSAHRIYDHEYSIQEEDSKETSPQIAKEKSGIHFSGLKEDDQYSIQPQGSISKMPEKSKKIQNHFFKPIPSTMSIKSSNPILKKLNKKFKSKNLKKTQILRETYGLVEENRVIDSNKSVKFSEKDLDQSKQDLFNISDNKSRLSNFSADFFPTNSNFTYDVNKIKQKLRTKNEIYNEKLNIKEISQDETKSQKKPSKIKKNSMMIPRNLENFEAENKSENDFEEEEDHTYTNFQKYQKVIYNTNKISNNQFNIINMTLSVHGENYSGRERKANQADFIVSRDHNDSYNYSKNSIDR